MSKQNTTPAAKGDAEEQAIRDLIAKLEEEMSQFIGIKGNEGLSDSSGRHIARCYNAGYIHRQSVPAAMACLGLACSFACIHMHPVSG
jgi:hypothetical protein